MAAVGVDDAPFLALGLKAVRGHFIQSNTAYIEPKTLLISGLASADSCLTAIICPP